MNRLLLTVYVALVAGWFPRPVPGAERAWANESGRSMTVEHEGGPFLPGAEHPISLFPRHPELEERYSEESLVRMAYRALEESIRSSSHVASFSLRDFSTYYQQDFERLRVRDLVTLDAVRRLEVRTTEVTGVDGTTIGRTYTPRWREEITAADLDEVREFMALYGEFTVAQALRHPEASDEMKRMIAVTSYEVTAEFEGEKQTYRAVFKWVPAVDEGVTFMVEDHVTDGVDRVLLEDTHVAPLAVLLDRSRGRPGEHVEERR